MGESDTNGADSEAPDLKQLPLNMLVAIDGISEFIVRPVGKQIAKCLGGVLADSWLFYRSLTKACLEAGINVQDYDAVWDFCGRARLDMWVRRQSSGFDEALVFVNGDVFNEAELCGVNAETPWVATNMAARARSREVLERLTTRGRLVALGRDIGNAVFRSTPYKAHLSSPKPPQNAPIDAQGGFDSPIRVGVLDIDGTKWTHEQACQQILEHFVQKSLDQRQLEMSLTYDRNLKK